MQLIRTLACLNPFENTPFPQREVLFVLFKMTQPLGTCLYKSLLNTRILRRDSQLRTMFTECESVRQKLRRAPLVGPSDTQFPEATVDAVMRLDQAQAMRSTITFVSSNSEGF